MESDYSQTNARLLEIAHLEKVVPFYEHPRFLLEELKDWKTRTVFSVGCMSGEIRSKHISRAIKRISNDSLIALNPDTFGVAFGDVPVQMENMLDTMQRTQSHGLFIIAYEAPTSRESAEMFEPLRFIDVLKRTSIMPKQAENLASIHPELSMVVVNYAHSDIDYPY